CILMCRLSAFVAIDPTRRSSDLFDSRLRRHDPDLQEVDEIGVRRIELTVSDTTARTHALNIAIRNDRTGAHAVLMLELSIKHIGNDFHIAVTVRSKAFAWLHPVFIDHSQRSYPHVSGIVVLCERESVPRTEPSMLCNTTF